MKIEKQPKRTTVSVAISQNVKFQNMASVNFTQKRQRDENREKVPKNIQTLDKR
jgi:acid phosphatase class B